MGMGRELYESESVVRQTFLEASDALSIDMRKLCFDGSNADLARTENTQPAVLTYSLALYRLWMSREGIEPDAVAGHSLGEITALTIAGALRFEDAVRIARRRGQLMQEAVPEGQGLMLAVQTRDAQAVHDLCEQVSGQTHEVVSVSNYNSMRQVVVAGKRSAVMAVHDVLDAQGIQSTLLNVSVPFHCSLMEPVVDPLRQELEAVVIDDLRIPVVANATGGVYESAADVMDLLTRQVIAPVRWVDNQRFLRRNGFTYAVEVGPGSTLTKFMRHTFSDIRSFAYDKEEGRADAHRMVQRMTFPFVPRALGVAAATRNANFSAEAYQSGVVVPFREIQRIGAGVDKEQRQPSQAELHHVLSLLLTILRTKGLADEDRRERIDELIRDTRTAESFAGIDAYSL